MSFLIVIIHMKHYDEYSTDLNNIQLYSIMQIINNVMVLRPYRLRYKKGEIK